MAKLANMAIAIAIVVAKGTRKEETPAEEQIFRCMTAPEWLIFDRSDYGRSQRLFNGLMDDGAVYG